MTELSATVAQRDERLSTRRIDLGTSFVEYQSGWAMQQRIHESVANGDEPPVILMLEHEAVFTAGRRTMPTDLPSDGTGVIEVDRGGRITWHGPGQLVCYPIVPLPHPLDVVAHVRRMEHAIMATCSEFGIDTHTVEGRSGVWCAPTTQHPESKIAAIGVRVARGVTMHGLSLNIDCDLSWAQRIVPCGIPDAGVTSMARELDPAPHPSLLAVADRLEQHLYEVFLPTLENPRHRLAT